LEDEITIGIFQGRDTFVTPADDYIATYVDYYRGLKITLLDVHAYGKS